MITYFTLCSDYVTSTDAKGPTRVKAGCVGRPLFTAGEEVVNLPAEISLIVSQQKKYFISPAVGRKIMWRGSIVIGYT